MQALTDAPHDGDLKLDAHGDIASTVVAPAKPVRSLKLTVVTDSELQTFRSCPQLHHFKYRERLRPLVAGKALAVGSIFHRGMSAGLLAGWDDVGMSLGNDSLRWRRQINVATNSIDDLVGEWAAKIVEHSTVEIDFEHLSAEVDETARMVKFMLAHYFESARGDLTTLVLVDAEKAFSVPMRDKRGRPVPHLRYEGVRDALFYDPTYNQLVLAEHKTVGGHPSSIEKRVEMDTQSSGYLHAISEVMRPDYQGPPLSAGPKLVPRDASIGRVMFNALRKTFPEPPKVNKDGSVSVAACTTTVAMYEAALVAQETERKIPRTQRQREFLDEVRGKGDVFFARVEYHKTTAEIERWRSDAFANARRIREADRDPQCRTLNPGNCNMPWSLPCSYRSICLDDAPELRAQFRVASDVHTEVRDAEVAQEGTTP